MVASLQDRTQGFLAPSTRSLVVSSHIKSCLASIPNRILDRLTVYDLWILIIHTLSFLPPFLLYWLLLGNQLSCCEDTQAILRRGPCIKKTAVSLPTTSTNFLAFWVTHGGRSSSPSFHKEPPKRRSQLWCICHARVPNTMLQQHLSSQRLFLTSLLSLSSPPTLEEPKGVYRGGEEEWKGHAGDCESTKRPRPSPHC